MAKTLQVRGKFNLHTFHETIDTNHLLFLFFHEILSFSLLLNALIVQKNELHMTVKNTKTGLVIVQH